MAKYILEDTYNDGKPKYFKQMTGIGPMATPEKDEAGTDLVATDKDVK